MTLSVNRRSFVTGSAACLIGASAPALAATRAVRPEDYDALSDEQLGVVNHVVHIATQPNGEWYGMGIPSYQGGDEGYRWQVGWWLQPLAVTQNRLPAYRDIYKRSFEGFLGKMAHRDSWSYWEAQSKGMAMNDSLGLPGHEMATADPIARDNINYSANTMNLMAMHQMFYQDGTYLQPHSFVLKHWTDKGLEVFSYDLEKVARAIYDGFAATNWRGVACEVNGVYPAYCNQLALVGFKQYDQLIPGGLGARLITNHVKAWQEVSDLYKMGAHRPGAPEPYIPRAYYVKQDAMVAMGDTMMTSAAYVNAWDPEWVQENYTFWKKRFSVENDVVSVKLEPQMRGGHLHINPYAPSGGTPAANWSTPGQGEKGETPAFYYYAAISAAEMGDQEFLAAIQRHALKFGNGPAWKDNEFFYERNDLTGPARMSRGGSVLMSAAMLVEKGGFRSLYNRPWTAEQLKTPYLEQVSWPDVLVRRATYDQRKEALVLTLLGAQALRNRDAAPVDTQFAIANLDPAKSYQIFRDGAPIGQLDQGKVQKGHEALQWVNGRLMIRSQLGRDSSYVIQTA